MITPSQLTVLTSESMHPRPGAPMARLPRRRRRASHNGEVSIRLATDRDASAVSELEALDGRYLGCGTRLIGELGGVPVAAISVADDTVVADPFERSSGVADLLRVRARQLRIAGTPRPAPRLALLERLAR